MTDTKSPLDGLTTMTGEPLIAALNALDEKLPDGAYKPVTMNGRTFTDISPAYSTEEIGSHFGPLGVGWGYTILNEQYVDGFKTNSGKSYVSVTIKLKLWYAYLDGKEIKYAEWEAYGGNANAGAGADEHYSWQGALTNAIGKGWSLVGFQRTIYKGEDFIVEPPNPWELPAADMAKELVASAQQHDTGKKLRAALRLADDAKMKDIVDALGEASAADHKALFSLADGTIDSYEVKP